VNKIRLSTFLLTLAVAVISFGYMTPSFAGKNCEDGDTRPRCTGGGGGGGGGNEAPATFDAALTMGGFRFGPKTVTLNKRGNHYSGAVGLNLDRADASGADQVAWDSVFSTCSLFDDVNGIPQTVPSVLVADTWSIDNAGGNQAGTIDSNIMVSFRDVIAPDFPEVDIDFRLMGILRYLIPKVVGESIEIDLSEFKFWGGLPGEVDCNSDSQLLIPGSKLVLTRTQ